MTASLIPDSTRDGGMSRCLSPDRIARNACQNRIFSGCRLSGGYRESARRSDSCIQVKVDLVGIDGTLARTAGSVKQGSFTAGVVIKGSGHWLMEEAREQVIPRLVAFINKSN
jgi:hypothetical protein